MTQTKAEEIYRYILVAVTWIASLLVTWMFSSQRVETKIDDALMKHNRESGDRLISIEKRLDKIENKIDMLSYRTDLK